MCESKAHIAMRIYPILLLVSLFFSCTEETKKPVSVSNELSDYIQKRYQTTDVTSSSALELKHGKTTNSFLVSVGQSTLIDSSKSSPKLFASDIAFRLYCGMKKAERKNYDVFAVKINQRSQVTEMRYSNKELREVNTNLLWLEGFFRLIDEKEYALAKRQFNPKLVDTSTVALETTFESMSQDLGKLKNRELQGFEINDVKVGSKTYRVLQANYILFYEKHYSQSKYALLMDETEQKLVNFNVE